MSTNISVHMYSVSLGPTVSKSIGHANGQGNYCCANVSSNSQKDRNSHIQTLEKDKFNDIVPKLWDKPLQPQWYSWSITGIEIFFAIVFPPSIRVSSSFLSNCHCSLDTVQKSWVDTNRSRSVTTTYHLITIGSIKPDF